jgi:putative peptidoglycan binding protein/CHAP domain-containing protein
VATDVHATRPHTARPTAAPARQPKVSDLHLSSPPMGGVDVLEVQQKLHALGYAPGKLDGIYATATAGAVKAFQRDHSLEVDGVVGPKTRAVLNAAPTPAKPVPNVRKASSIGRLALAVAIQEIGAKESPANSNKNKFGKWFGVDGVAWCNIFVSYCFLNGAKYVICSDQTGGGVYAKGCTYVPTTEAWLKATGMWKGRTEPLPGDIAIYNWDGGVPDHIGIVEEYLGGGQFHAIEGNTAVGNDSNGGQVMRRLRYMSNVDGFGRIA